MSQAPMKPIKPPPFKIKTRAERKENHFLKILIYADYGVGKTYLAGTAADVDQMGDVLMINAESGELTLDTVDEHNFDRIDTIDATTFAQVAMIYDYLRLHCQYREAGDIEMLRKSQARFMGLAPADIKDEDIRRYRTVIIDSLTEVEAYCMNQLLGISESAGMHEETQTAEFKEYKQQFNMMQRLVRSYRDLPMHVIFTAARQYVQDDQKRMIFTPSLTGKLAGQVQGFMDIVGYLITGTADDAGNVPRRMYIQPVGRYSAKSRFSNFKGSHIDNPTMKSILTQVGLYKVKEATKPQTEKE